MQDHPVKESVDPVVQNPHTLRSMGEAGETDSRWHCVLSSETAVP